MARSTSADRQNLDAELRAAVDLVADEMTFT
jgi:hypothetical protein